MMGSSFSPPERGAGLVGDLLPTRPQIQEWAQRLCQARAEGRRVAVATTAESYSAGRELARACSTLLLDASRLGRDDDFLSDGDLLIMVMASPTSLHWPIAPVMRNLLQQGVLVWGMTGPLPNLVADHCHDVVTVPSHDRATVIRVQHLAIRLIRQAMTSGDGSPPGRLDTYSRRRAM